MLPGFPETLHHKLSCQGAKVCVPLLLSFDVIVSLLPKDQSCFHSSSSRQVRVMLLPDFVWTAYMASLQNPVLAADMLMYLFQFTVAARLQFHFQCTGQPGSETRTAIYRYIAATVYTTVTAVAQESNLLRCIRTLTGHRSELAHGPAMLSKACAFADVEPF